MTDDKIQELQAELKPICEKFGITHAAITGEIGEIDATGKIDSIWFGMLIPQNSDRRLDAVAAFHNIGRLFQFAKEQNRKVMNLFERLEQ